MLPINQKLLRLACSLVFGFGVVITASAQDAAITNARIIIGNGDIIESGTIIVRNGRITEVGSR